MSSVQIVGWTSTEFETMAMVKLNERLGHGRKGMLKNFHCASLMATSVKEAIEFERGQDQCYQVAGFLSLDDSGVGRAFDFMIEKGLDWKQAEDLADKMALQVDQCCDRMIADQKGGRS